VVFKLTDEFDNVADLAGPWRADTDVPAR